MVEIRERLDSSDQIREIDSQHHKPGGKFSAWHQQKFFETQSQYVDKTGQLKLAYKKPQQEYVFQDDKDDDDHEDDANMTM